MSFKDDAKNKIKELEALNIVAYASDFKRTHSIEDIKNLPIGTKVATAGRIILDRDLGALRFIKISNIHDQVQIFIKISNIDDNIKNILKLINVGDIIGVYGEVNLTKTGELSIFLEDIKVLSKALDQMGDKWRGITDVELRLRKRYGDLISNSTTRETFHRRHKLIRNIRNYLYDDGFTEVETPILQNIPSGASANPFVTHYEALNEDFYLRVAPELFLKRLIVGGYEKVFEIGKCFRNEGIDRSHLQEFTMIEIYRAYASYEELQQFAVKFLQTIVEKTMGTLETKKVDFRQVESISYDDLFIKYGGVDIRGKNETQLKEIALQAGLELGNFKSIDALKDGIYKKLCLSKIVNPVLVYDYPSTPLSYHNPKKPGYNLQFQIIVGHFEIVRACIELTDSELQNNNFNNQMKLNMETGEKDVVRKDEDFIQALEWGMAPTAGMGLGIDRLMMLLCDDEVAIRDVVLFPPTKVKN